MIARNFDRIIEKIIRIIIPFIFFLPLVVNSDYYFPFITPRNFVFRILISLAFGLYLIIWTRNKEKYKPLVNKAFYFYLILIAILTISSLVNGSFLYSFWSGYERMDGLVSLYYLLLFLIVILGVYKNQKSWQYLLRITVFVSFIVSFIALGQYFDVAVFLPFSGEGRASSMLGNPIYLATYNLFNLFFAVYLLTKKNINLRKTELWLFYIFDFVLILIELWLRKQGKVGPVSQILGNLWLSLALFVPQLFVHINYYGRKNKKLLANYSHSLYFLGIIVINFFSLFNTQTRGPLLALIFSIFCLFLFSKDVSKKVKKTILLLCIILALLLSSVFIFKDRGFVKNHNTLYRLSSISLNDITTESRVLTWQLSFKGFLEKPVLGYGQENFYVVFNKYFPAEIFKDKGSQIWFDRPHNIFLQYLIDGGILALLAYMSVFFFIFKSLYKHYKKSRDLKTIGIFGTLIIAYLFQNFFVFDSLNTNILFILLLAISIFISSEHKPKKDLQNRTSNKLLLGMTLFISVVVLAYFINIPQMRANQNLVINLRDIRLNAFNGYDKTAYQTLLESINSNYLGKFESRQVFSDHVRELILSSEVTYADKVAPLSLAESELIRSISEQPNNVRHYSFLMDLYVAASFLDSDYAAKNAIIAEKAFPLSPNRAPLYTSLARSYFYSGQYDKAIALFKKAREISPYNVDVLLDLFGAYVFTKDVVSANAFLLEFDNNFERPYLFNGEPKNMSAALVQAYAERYYLRFADVYFRFSYTQEAIDILEKQLKKYPNSVVFLERLGVYYNSLGDSDKALFYSDNLQKISPQ